ANASTGAASLASKKDPPGRPARVAIVDDEDSVREALTEIIEISGEFVCAGTYKDASDALAGIPKAHADVVLMDIRMPGMSGIECTRKIKSLLPTVKIVMLTALPDVSLTKESFQAGADGYLTKPFRVEE